MIIDFNYYKNLKEIDERTDRARKMSDDELDKLYQEYYADEDNYNLGEY